MRLFIMQLPVVSCNCLSHRTKYVPQYPVLVHPQLMFSPKCEIQVPHPNKATDKIMGLYALPFIYFREVTHKISGVNCSGQSLNLIFS